MRDRPMPRVGKHRFGMHRQLVGDAVAVEFAGGAGGAVEADEPDVGGPRERHPGVAVAAAADQQAFVVDTQAEVTEDSVDQSAGRRDPTALRHQRALLVKHRGS